MPRALDRLIAKFLLSIDRMMDQLESAALTPDAWRDVFAQELARFHLAAGIVGNNGTLTDQVRSVVERTVGTQIEFLDGFKAVIQDAAEFQRGWRARALLYAQSIKAPYWAGATKFLPLPALPGDGSTQCLGNCRCFWEITTVDEEAGDYDCYWRMGASEHHCQTCPQRMADWSPLRIRNGRIV